MTRSPRKLHGRSDPEKTTGIEWIGGEMRVPSYVIGEGEPYRPTALVWIGADGKVLGSTMGKPGELLPLASESLQTAIATPLYGPPHRPTRVRVADPALAEALRVGHPELEVVCAATPELDELMALMREDLAEADATKRSYLAPGITPEAMAALFKAAAALFRVKPWKVVPDDECLFAVTIEALGLRDLVMSVVGRREEDFGFVLFSDLDTFDAHLDAIASLEEGEEATVASHFSLYFEHGADLPPQMHKEVFEHHWEVAGAAAYPWPMATDEDLVSRPPTGREVTVAETLALALTRVVADDKETLRAAWEGGDPVVRTLSITTHAGAFEVKLRTPHERKPVVREGSDDLLAELAALSGADDPSDDAARESLENELVNRFAVSPEAKDLDGIQSYRWVMDLGANHLGHTIATLRAMDLREVLFEIIPRKVSVEAREARAIVDELRAFYSFLKREFELPQADACLQVLGDDAVKELKAALSDRRNFGPAKSMFMAGAEAGFDMQSKEGIDAWMRTLQGKPLPPSIPLPSLPQPSRKAADLKDKRRKAARKARKRNR